MHKGFRTTPRLGMSDPMGTPWHRAWLDWSSQEQGSFPSQWKQGQASLSLR